MPESLRRYLESLPPVEADLVWLYLDSNDTEEMIAVIDKAHPNMHPIQQLPKDEQCSS